MAMKVAQEIDVDGITIIINSNNKLEAIPTGSAQELTLKEVDWLNDPNIITEEAIYEINNSKKYLKGIKPIKYIKEIFLNNLPVLSNSITTKFSKSEEQGSYSYGMEKYIRIIEGTLVLDISTLQSYKLSDDDISNILKEFLNNTKGSVYTQNYERFSIFGSTLYSSMYYTFGINDPESRVNIRIEGSTAHLDIYEKLEFLTNRENQDFSHQSLNDLVGEGTKDNSYYSEIETLVTENNLPIVLRITSR